RTASGWYPMRMDQGKAVATPGLGYQRAVGPETIQPVRGDISRHDQNRFSGAGRDGSVRDLPWRRAVHATPFARPLAQTKYQLFLQPLGGCGSEPSRWVHRGAPLKP